VAAHDGLDLPGDAVEELAGEGSLGLGLERADLPHLVQVAHLHRRSRFHAGAARFETDWERRGGWRAFVQGRARRSPRSNLGGRVLKGKGERASAAVLTSVACKNRILYVLTYRNTEC
jgi:hypothetical protein